MQHTLKESDPRINLLYLEYPESLFNSIKAYGSKMSETSNNM